MKKSRKRLIKYYAAWAVLYAAETIIAAVPTIITALVLLPFEEASRGGNAFGGEWFFIAFVFAITFIFTDRCFVNAIYKDEK